MDSKKKSPPTSYKLQVRVDPPFYVAIMRNANSKDKSVSGLIRDAIRKEIGYKDDISTTKKSL